MNPSIRQPCPLARMADDGAPEPRPWYWAYLERRKGVICAAGTRVKATTVASLFEGGFSYSEIKVAYPELRDQHIRACLTWREEEGDDRA